ncbi:zinc finger and SCAN domain-containing protein 16-like [Belonocnema kinseyi]|uniref:zinc finger and SCAN domain-containing protein 16-like n=1 Tax=Belonocnema kinseyi TaxID=2817044 RepID=UPI00143D8480|nr:zinc finger and SCAN domain-containing protein 16-like [Belonocnema kinseyi]
MSTGQYEACFLKLPREQHSLLFENSGTDFAHKIEDRNDEKLEIKEEMVEIEYIIDEVLEIKEKVMEAQETTDQKRNKKYKLKLDAVDVKETNNFAVNDKQPEHYIQKIQEPEPDPEKKYKCEKCARTYKHRGSLFGHRKFECGVIPQFKCKFCDKRFKQKISVNRHIGLVHEKKNSKKSELKHKCDQCSRSYAWLDSLNRHKRSEHSTVKPQFTCDYCGFKTNHKCYLPAHMSIRHLKEIK